MAKKLLFPILALLSLLLFVSSALAIDIYLPNEDKPSYKTEDLRLEIGENASILLSGGSPYAIRLHKGAIVDLEADNVTHYFIFDQIGDNAVIRYSGDNQTTWKQFNVKLGDQLKINLTTGSMFLYMNYKIFHDSVSDPKARTAVVEFGIPYINSMSGSLNSPVEMTPKNSTEQKIQNITQTITEEKEAGENKAGNSYVKYLIGVIIVLVLIIIILGPRKKDKVSEKVNEVKEAVSKKIGKKKGKEEVKDQPVAKTYFKKPKKKNFDEEDVYVVKPSDE